MAPGQPDSLARKEVDLRRWELGPGEAPEIPITLMASDRRLEGDQPDTTYALWERWNDYGIGLFLEGDTRGALEAFNQVSMIASQSPEGPINLARVHLAEGSLEAAETQLEEAEEREPGYLKTAYFRAEVLRGYGEYDDAIVEWLKVYEAYPNDRVLLLAIARMHYLMERYDTALQWIDRVLTIDPEDLGGLYNRMLTLGALERTEELQEAQRLYEFHKEDETALAVTGPYKQRHPSDNSSGAAHPSAQFVSSSASALTRRGKFVVLLPPNINSALAEFRFQLFITSVQMIDPADMRSPFGNQSCKYERYTCTQIRAHNTCTG